MSQPWIDLSGTVCVITGASGGIGSAIARGFAEVGAAVALLDRDEATLEQLAVQLRDAGATALPFRCDVSDPGDVSRVAEEVKRQLGPSNVVVNNAGILRPGSLAEISQEEWRQLFDVNFHGYFNMSQTFGAQMRGQGKGALVHVASIAGTNPQPFSGAYSASKAAILMMSRQLAFEWGPMGIRSNAVSPGQIRTPLSEKFYADEGMIRARESVVPTRRIARPEDIADAAVFLASERASYVNGQDIVVDGGFIQTTMSHIPRPGYGPT